MTDGTNRRAGALPYVLLVLTMCFWALNNIVSKMAVGVMPPPAVAFWSWGLGLAVLTPFGLPRLLARRDLLAKHWLKMVMIGVLGINFFYHLFLNSLTFTTAINATLVLSTMPIAIVFLSWLLYRDPFSWRGGLGTIISLVGVVVVIVQGDLGVLIGLGVNSGDILALAAVISWGFYTVFLRHMPEGLDPLAYLWVFAAAGTVVNGLIYVSEIFTPMGFELTWQGAAMIGYSAIFPLVLAFVFYNAGVRMIGAAAAGQFFYLLPILAAILAIIVLGESVEVYHLVGLVVILVGLFLATAPAGLFRRGAE
jgi:drug/metabolite transporter (DMT)-like permease